LGTLMPKIRSSPVLPVLDFNQKTGTYFTKDRMTLDQAVDIMEQYAVNLDLDDLSAVEHMVRHFKTLPQIQRRALETFMDASKQLYAQA
jgi:hypothetical protein